MSDFIGTILVGLLVAAVVFLILREFFCWYWKINQRIELLTEIRNLLRNQACSDISNEVNIAQQAINSDDIEKGPIFCTNCGAKIEAGTFECVACGTHI
jgi:hypothetical protein